MKEAKKQILKQLKEISRISDDSVLVNEIENVAKYICSNNFQRICVIGLGKSGHIGKKISATISSTSLPSYFIHASEALHGDLGMILNKKDFIFAISNSGSTSELVQVVKILSRRGESICSIVGKPNSKLESISNFTINYNSINESCPLKLAPMSSTTLALVCGDAIASSLMVKLKTNKELFKKNHPGGTLGKIMNDSIINYVIPKKLCSSSVSQNFAELIKSMNENKIGAQLIYENKKFYGLVTDGDIRRGIENYSNNIFEIKLRSLISNKPMIVDANEDVNDVYEKMKKSKTTVAVVSQFDKVIGLYKI